MRELGIMLEEAQETVEATAAAGDSRAGLCTYRPFCTACPPPRRAYRSAQPPEISDQPRFEWARRTFVTLSLASRLLSAGKWILVEYSWGGGGGRLETRRKSAVADLFLL